MNDKNYEVLRALNLIAEKTKSQALKHGGKLAIYLFLELICYLVFLLLFLLAFLFPNGPTLSFEAERMHMNLGVTVEMLDSILTGLKIGILVISLFPLGMGLILMSSRKKSKRLYEVHKLTNEVIRIIVDGKGDRYVG